MHSESFQPKGPEASALGPGDADRRASGRREVRASLILELDDAVGVCRVVDLSPTGALFSAAGTTLPTLELWSQHTVSITAYANPALEVEVTGRIVRCVGDIYALDWAGREDTQAAVAAFLAAMRRQGARASTEHGDALAPRVAVSATLLIEHGGRAEELVLVEVTRASGLIASAGAALSRVRAGALVFLNLARSDDPSRQVDVAARVSGHEGHATRVDWSEDAERMAAVDALLGDLVPAS